MKFTLIITLVFFAIFSHGQVRVINENLKPIKNVQVLNDGELVAVSDSSGFFTIDINEAPSKILVLSHPFYHDRALKIKTMKSGIATVQMQSKTTVVKGVVVLPKGRIKAKVMAKKVEGVSSKEITLYQPSTTADALGIGQKVYIQKSQAGGGSPMLRGFATNRILLVVDDVRMNTAIFRSGNVQNVVSIDPYSLEQTDIIFGPASQLYGSDALGGVLHFKTKSPQLGTKDSILYQGNVALRVGSANLERSWHFDFNVGGEKLASFSSISFNSFGHTRMGEHGPDTYLRPSYVASIQGRDTQVLNIDPSNQVFSNYNQINALQKFRYVPTKDLELSYNFQYSTSSDIQRYDRLILADTSGNLENAEWYYGPQKWMLNQGQLLWRKKSAFADSLKITIANQQFEESRNDRKFASPWRRTRIENVSANSFNLDLSKQLGTNYDLIYGGEYIHNYIKSSGSSRNIEDFSFVGIASRYPNGATWASSGAYASITRSKSKEHISDIGIRYNVVQAFAVFDTNSYSFLPRELKSNNSAITGSISHLYRYKKGRIGFVASTGFRSPNIDDLAKVFDSNPGLVIIPNVDLKPEYTYNGEWNIEHKVKDKLRLGATIFYTYLDNALTTTNTQVNGLDSIYYDGILSQVQTLMNIDQASVFGSQVQASLLFSEYIKLNSSFTFIKSGFNNEEPVRHITPHFGATTLSYAKDQLQFAVYSQYHTRFDYSNFSINERQDAYLYPIAADGNPYSPAWCTLNLRGAYQWTHNVTVNAAAENILNKRYRPYGSGITANGINFIISMQAKF